VEMPKKTNCYTYKVEMIVQVLSSAEHFAKVILEERGGYVSSRKVTLINSFDLYEDFEADKEKEISSNEETKENDDTKNNLVVEEKDKEETVLETKIDENKNIDPKDDVIVETKNVESSNLETSTQDVLEEGKS
jgi:hypothetical protein